MRALLRRPLVRFALVGFAVLVAHRALRPLQPKTHDDVIVVDAAVREHVRRHVADTEGHAPDAARLDAAMSRWVEDEMLYREAVARGLDRDDPLVRERLASKMATLLKAQVLVPEPTEAELRAWFDAHAARFGAAALVDFTHVFIRGDDAAANARATALLEELRAGADPARMGDSFQGGHRYRRRKIPDLEATFGPTFTAGLGAQAVGAWALRTSRFGLHLVRVDRKTGAAPADFAAARLDVQKALQDERRAAGLRALIEGLHARFRVQERP